MSFMFEFYEFYEFCTGRAACVCCVFAAWCGGVGLLATLRFRTYLVNHISPICTWKHIVCSIKEIKQDCVARPATQHLEQPMPDQYPHCYICSRVWANDA